MDRGGIYYAKTDGSQVVEAMHPVLGPNGIGLSPDEKTLYIAETETSRCWSYQVLGPGKLSREPFPSPNGGKLVAGMAGFQRFDSMAIEAGGNICIATLVRGGITVMSPDGAKVEHIPLPDLYVTNICFGGPNLCTAFITMSYEGRLVAMDWPRPGLPLNFLNRK
jgi:gluconolactonase